MKRVALCIFGALLMGSASAQETMYVDDELTINMRSGEGTQYRIIRMLKSGTKLDIIQTNPETGYSLARIGDDIEGWVQTQYLSKEPIARDQLTQARSRVESLEKRNNELQQQLADVNKRHGVLDKQSSTLEQENQSLSQELAHIKEVSANAVALDKDNKIMREQAIRMETEIQALQQQISVLKDRSTRDWFITGAVVTIFGMLIGLILPKMRIQRRSNWNEL